MARGKKTGGRNFKRGETANRSGRPRVPGEIRELYTANRLYIARRMSELFDMPVNEYRALKRDATLNTLDALIISLMDKAYKGNTQAFTLLMDRVCGKAIQPIEHSGAGDAEPVRLVISPEFVAGYRPEQGTEKTD